MIRNTVRKFTYLITFLGLLSSAAEVDCVPNNCVNGSKCWRSHQATHPENYACECLPGFGGRHCENDLRNVNDCAGVTCENGGTCVDMVGGYRCTCQEGWGGKNCQTAVFKCDSGYKQAHLQLDASLPWHWEYEAETETVRDWMRNVGLTEGAPGSDGVQFSIDVRAGSGQSDRWNTRKTVLSDFIRFSSQLDQGERYDQFISTWEESNNERCHYYETIATSGCQNPELKPWSGNSSAWPYEIYSRIAPSGTFVFDDPSLDSRSQNLTWTQYYCDAMNCDEVNYNAREALNYFRSDDNDDLTTIIFADRYFGQHLASFRTATDYEDPGFQGVTQYIEDADDFVNRKNNVLRRFFILFNDKPWEQAMTSYNHQRGLHHIPKEGGYMAPFDNICHIPSPFEIPDCLAMIQNKMCGPPNPCDTTDPCQNGVCEPSADYQTATCNCDGTNFAGQFCQNEIDDCEVNSEPRCKNGGTCNDITPADGTADCICATGWSGDRCENQIGDCDNNSCQYGATCIDVTAFDGQYSCSCPTGFTGDHCENLPTPGSQIGCNAPFGIPKAAETLLSGIWFDLSNHGCHCSKFGNGHNYKCYAVDELDTACKNWRNQRQCLDLGDCVPTCSYDSSVSCDNLTADCEKKACQIDAHFVGIITGIVAGDGFQYAASVSEDLVDTDRDCNNNGRDLRCCGDFPNAVKYVANEANCVDGQVQN